MKLSKVVLSYRKKLTLDVSDLRASTGGTLQRDIRGIIESVFSLDQKLLGQILSLPILILPYEFNGVGIQL